MLTNNVSIQINCTVLFVIIVKTSISYLIYFHFRDRDLGFGFFFRNGVVSVVLLTSTLCECMENVGLIIVT